MPEVGLQQLPLTAARLQKKGRFPQGETQLRHSSGGCCCPGEAANLESPPRTPTELSCTQDCVKSSATTKPPCSPRGSRGAPVPARGAPIPAVPREGNRLQGAGLALPSSHIPSPAEAPAHPPCLRGRLPPQAAPGSGRAQGSPTPPRTAPTVHDELPGVALQVLPLDGAEAGGEAALGQQPVDVLELAAVAAGLGRHHHLPLGLRQRRVHGRAGPGPR